MSLLYNQKAYNSRPNPNTPILFVAKILDIASLFCFERLSRIFRHYH